jgi:class 3 adenylate cyclase
VKSSTEILNEVSKTFATKWATRDGRVVPEQEDIQLGNDGVILDATVLYADMTDSTELVDNYKDWFAAEMYKSYLLAACHVIRNNKGTITSFDGDRVMAVFIGNTKYSVSAKAA